MEVITPAVTIAHTIQLAVAPVFLLTGIGAILAVLTGRLGRIIDRSRVLNSRRLTTKKEEIEAIDSELRIHEMRSWNINWAIGLSTACALLVCVVIALLFMQEFISVNGLPIAVLFITAMACLITALIFFLREIYLATAKINYGP